MAHILVVDDELLIRQMLKRMLEMEGYEVTTASNGNMAINLVREKHVDLVITDVLMSEADGLELLMKMKKQTCGIKIIAISGGGRIGSQDCLKMARRIGAQRVFPKPVAREEMLKAIKDLLG